LIQDVDAPQPYAKTFDSGRLIWRLVAGVVILDLLVGLMAGLSVIQSRDRDRDLAIVAAQNLSGLLKSDLVGQFDKIDLSVQAVKIEAERQLAAGGFDGDRFDALITWHLSQQPSLELIRMGGADGAIIHGSRMDRSKTLNIADRDYFLRLRDDPAAGLVVSEPIVGLSTGKWSIVLARRVNGPTGAFAGVVFAALALEQTHKQFATLDIGPRGSVSLRALDLSTVSRYPTPEAIGIAPGNKTHSPEWEDELKVHPNFGTYSAVSPDGLRRNLAYNRVGQYPFYVIVGLFPDDYSLQSRWHAGVTAGILALFFLVTGIFAWLTARAWQRRDADSRKVVELSQLSMQRSEENLSLAIDASNAKSIFLANMSHEIRTPLNAILGFAQIGLRDPTGLTSKDHFARILDSGQGLSQIIDDILDASKMQAGRIRIENVPMLLGDVIDHSLQLVALRAQTNGLTLTVREAVDLPISCLGDPGRLRQVLANLLTNAVKFTPAGGSVTLTAGRDPGELTFTVSDTGIGIAADDLKRLFQPFEQADTTTTRRFGGTGLGLSISRQLVDLMGGTLTVKSVPGEGSSFMVRLPLADEVPAAAMDGVEVIAVSLPDTETAILADGFVRCGIATDLDHLPDRPVLAVVDGSLLESDATKVEAALRRGVKLAAALNLDQLLMTARWDRNLLVVERPLRWRHLRQASSRSRQDPQPKTFTARLAGLVVLVAEDNPINRLVLDDMLRLEGAEVILCEDGKQALERVRQSGGQGIDVLLTDIQMPAMDGYALARAVARHVPDLPIIGLTAHAMAEARESCLAAGMVEHITKPVDLDHLVAVIRLHALRHPQPPVIDMLALTARYSGRSDFIRRLIHMARTTHDGTVTRLREAAAAKDLPVLAELAHTVKGSAGILHAAPLQALATEVEREARNGSADAAVKAQELIESMDDLMRALDHWQNDRQH